MLIVVGSAIILTTLVGLYICTCYRSSLSRPRNQPTSTSNQNLPLTQDLPGTSIRERRHLIYQVDDNNPPLCGIGAILGRRIHARSRSLPESIKISASRPTIFGDWEDAERSIQVVLTPPTPSKKGPAVAVSVVDQLEGDEIKQDVVPH
ncbi:hypothetical protein CPB84DRAFT_1842336 [Gymnopilus junonius]|uniref:Uncharacterized protein n=1 Tax=Gymnopilus junonius TaxID=109634 RepID=A0A9P5P058_GYMJU|nr:hypothetical protein CPB84DRAFT_1842336 [Gymnopilus junonius]